ncbi:leucine-rich repeat-containing protein 20 isoform X2 [Ctenopharyngodon idella]|nr:leucine-rich repeat-containing protein 20 isoform X2 [Ctenopharyngodon idella]XP_051771330.1 leucine-rich repeat-containing protein 20 isoform X2 [Ctenopharyngodon idella]XP_051771331.1 leucine-rich repeat-containing protein 20 isoform X2 [Ctenopharyngodon idella]XP_051771332.1 leucine-rich repeat-containing protein 20 isoform X2 [Ctenopharyngodon idella]XP_051771333.1 leucine-rich repeat-containing protein 20 isoform X2 [Ctenopharyngodon idella]XP_051771334.1 leucine-rich repeat-containing
MAEAVANVARRINATMEEGRDSLDLSDCGLVSFPDGVFKMIRSCTDNIHKISLANNQIKALSNKFFLTFTQLREVDLQGNVLSTLPEAVGNMEHLVSINLSKNKLTVFPERLTDVSSLQHINVEGNQITELPMEKLSLMPSLRSLDVRCNPLAADAASFPHHFTLLT